MTALPKCNKSLNPQVILVDEFTLVRVCSDSTHKSQRFPENSYSKCQSALLLYHTNELSIFELGYYSSYKKVFTNFTFGVCVCIAYPIKLAFPNIHRLRIIQIRAFTPKPLLGHQHSERTHIEVMVFFFFPSLQITCEQKRKKF